MAQAATLDGSGCNAAFPDPSVIRLSVSLRLSLEGQVETITVGEMDYCFLRVKETSHLTGFEGTRWRVGKFESIFLVWSQVQRCSSSRRAWVPQRFGSELQLGALEL